MADFETTYAAACTMIELKDQYSTLIPSQQSLALVLARPPAQLWRSQTCASPWATIWWLAKAQLPLPPWKYS